MVGLFGDILACTSSGWNEHTVCGGAASDVVDFVQSNALDFAKLICSRADATLVNNRMIIVCLAQNRGWLGAAYARGAVPETIQERIRRPPGFSQALGSC